MKLSININIIVNVVEIIIVIEIKPLKNILMNSGIPHKQSGFDLKKEDLKKDFLIFTSILI